MKKLLIPILNLFDGEGGDGNVGDQNSSANTQHSQGEVLYGKQENVQAASEPEVKTTSNTLEDKRKAFKQLVDGEYKDQYTEATQQIINRRFKETETLRSKVDEYQPLIDMLMTRYDKTDIKGIMESLDNDNAYWENVADELGMTVEQAKQFQKMKRENEVFQRQREEEINNKKIKSQVDEWVKEGIALKEKYVNFNLESELENQEFVRLLKANVPMEHAYKLIHFDEIIANNSLTTERAVVENIRARGSRPQENGTNAQSAFTVKDDVSKLTKEDRKKIAERAARGEVITF